MNGLAEKLAQGLGETPPAAPWLDELRREGAQAFRRHGLPGLREEAWKYTPLRLLEARLDAERGAPRTASALGLEADVRVALADGRAQEIQGRLRDGATVRPLTDALTDGDAELRELLAELNAEGPAQAFVALNTARLERGLVIRVPRGVDAGRVLLAWSGAGPGPWCDARICVLLEAGARLELVEHFTALGSALNVVAQLRLGEGARLEHARVQESTAADVLLTRTEVAQQAASHFRYTGLDLGSGLARHDLTARLRAPGAVCVMNGAYLPQDTGHVDNHLAAEHEAPDCTSEQYFRGVLDGETRAVFNGRVHVHPGADGSEAYQSNANLLLSERAEVNTKPELEIEADEVIASHGATVGQLDEKAVFYLRSRGLDEAQARTLLTAGFCRAVPERLEPGPLRDTLLERLDDVLGSWS